MKKVNMKVIAPWIETRLTELLGFEDEVVVGLVNNMLEAKKIDPKELQINLTGFLSTNAEEFVAELWAMLASASESVAGIPAVLLEKQKQQIKERQVSSCLPLASVFNIFSSILVLTDGKIENRG